MLDPFCKINYNNDSYLFMNDNKSLAICDMTNVDISSNSNKIKSFCYFFDFDRYESLINNNEYKKLSDKQKYKKLLKNEDYYYKKTNIPCTYIKNNNNLFVNTKISNDNNRYNIVKIKDNVNLNDFINNYLKNMNDINYKNNNNDINNYIDIIKSQNNNKNNNINYYFYFKKYFIIIFLLFVTIIIYLLYKNLKIIF